MNLRNQDIIELKDDSESSFEESESPETPSEIPTLPQKKLFKENKNNNLIKANGNDEIKNSENKIRNNFLNIIDRLENCLQTFMEEIRDIKKDVNEGYQSYGNTNINHSINADIEETFMSNNKTMFIEEKKKELNDEFFINETDIKKMVEINEKNNNIIKDENITNFSSENNNNFILNNMKKKIDLSGISLKKSKPKKRKVKIIKKRKNKINRNKETKKKIKKNIHKIMFDNKCEICGIELPKFKKPFGKCDKCKNLKI